MILNYKRLFNYSLMFVLAMNTNSVFAGSGKEVFPKTTSTGDFIKMDKTETYRNATDFERIVDRYVSFLFKTQDLNPNIEKIMESLNEDQQWPDINYEEQDLSLWNANIHLWRVKEMAFAWKNPESPFYQDESLWLSVELGLDHWLDERYKSANWWYNRIGIPQMMRDILVLVEEDLSPEQRAGAMEVLKQYHDENAGLGVGANRVWLADLGLHYGILSKNAALMREYWKHLIDEIKISTGEGLQADYSYHQHYDRLQMYQYGKAFLEINVRLSWQLKDSPFAFPEEKIDILEDFVFKGWQWMARGVHTVPGTMDRSATRVGELRSADIRYLIPFLKELNPKNANDYEALEKRQNGNGNLSGFRYYPFSDFAVYHQDDFSFFLKTISERTLPTEKTNNENLKGDLLNSGDAYLIRNGEEYYDLLPVWDWNFLPGVTSFKGTDHAVRKNFVGSVSNQKSGLSAMDYELEDKNKEKSVSAKKFWAVHDNIVVCLIANLHAENLEKDIYTTLDQARLQGEVKVDKTGKPLKEGEYELEKVEWIYHSGFAYIPLEPASISLKIGKAKGSWASINQGLSKEPLTDKVFLPVLQHDLKEKKSTGYVLAYSETAEDAKKMAANPKWKVLRNDKECQAVLFDDGTFMAAFYSPTDMKLNKGTIGVDRSCLVLIEEAGIFVSDPTHQGGKVNLIWNGRNMEIPVSKEGYTTGPLLVN